MLDLPDFQAEQAEYHLVLGRPEARQVSRASILF